MGRSEWRLGLGTYRLGPKTESTVQSALRIGYRHFDTAALYGNEAAVASAIAASHVPRGQTCVSTKLHIRDIDRLSIRKATEAALSRLGEIDVLMLHAWRPNAAEAWHLMREEVTAGRVRAIGVSNFGASDLASLAAPAPVVNQIELSPFLQRRALLDACRSSDIPVAAHSPLTKARRFADIDGVVGGHPAAQVLIAWGLLQASVVLPSSSDETHLAQNFAAQNIELSADQMEALSSLDDSFATHPNVVRT